jgi:hypothetical protein
MDKRTILNGLTEINWKQKLSSRKLWVGIALVLIGILLCLIGDVDNGIRVAAIGGSAYLGAEAIVDVIRIIFVESKERTETEEEN